LEHRVIEAEMCATLAVDSRLTPAVLSSAFGTFPEQNIYESEELRGICFPSNPQQKNNESLKWIRSKKSRFSKLLLIATFIARFVFSSI